MCIYKKVQRYIADNGLSQKEVAKKANIPISKFDAMLVGKATIYADDLRAICLALDVSSDTFIRQKTA